MAINYSLPWNIPFNIEFIVLPSPPNPFPLHLQDYYFINRQGKRNPMGRLYTKYYNTMKRMRVRDIHQDFAQEPVSYSTLVDDSMLTTTSTTSTPTSAALMLRPTSGTNGNEANNTGCNISPATGGKDIGNGSGGGDGSGSGSGNNTQIELIEDDFQELIQLDDTSVSAIKNFLRCQGLDWDDIKTMWSKTYLSRQEDVEHSTIKDVLQQWPKYLNARGIELVSLRTHTRKHTHTHSIHSHIHTLNMNLFASRQN